MLTRQKEIQKRARRKKNIFWGVSVLGGIYFGAVLMNLFTDNIVNNDWTNSNEKQFIHSQKLDLTANLLRLKRQANIGESTSIPGATASNDVFTNINNASNSDTKSQGIYPPDVFDLEARRKGAVVLHAIGMLYMFIALAIVCDEFFVPALEVIIYRLGISDDVAGATFMAAGGSAPELFTSIIGVFLAKSNVGIGTIVGSAVFNILFVIGMCSIFSHGVLTLTWWPLFRDCLFYIISLSVLIYSFVDYHIQFYESIALMLMYFFYVIFMKFNKSIEAWVKSRLPSCSSSSSSSSGAKVGPSDKKMPRSVRAIVESISSQEEGHPKNTFSYGIVQLIMHSLDPSTDDTTSNDKSSQLYAIARTKLISPRVARSVSISSSKSTKLNNPNAVEKELIHRPTTPTAVIYDNNEGVKVVAEPDQSREVFVDTSVTSAVSNLNSSNGKSVANKTPERKSSGTSSDGMGDALDMSWPKTCSKRCVYILLFPIMFLLWLTLPDVRIARKEKWFMASFFGSILWIAIFSYLMVWWAHQIGETIGLSETVMGLTFLAAGTSVPDLITSVIVARKGLGDMAVSSSVGSNIFDVTIGLPFPWLLKSIISSGEPIVVRSEGLFCSVLLLFAMLLFVVISIAVCRWKMSKKLAVIMLVLYIGFLVVSLLLELSVIQCVINTA